VEHFTHLAQAERAEVDVQIRGQAGPRFFQRFQGTFSDDGRTIAAYWERSEDGQSWQRDFDIRYTKARSA
jgi:hypothetical protein